MSDSKKPVRKTAKTKVQEDVLLRVLVVPEGLVRTFYKKMDASRGQAVAAYDFWKFNQSLFPQEKLSALSVKVNTTKIMSPTLEIWGQPPVVEKPAPVKKAPAKRQSAKTAPAE